MKKQLTAASALLLAPLLLSACSSSGSAPQAAPSPTPTYLQAGSFFDAPSQVEMSAGSRNSVPLDKGLAFFARKPKETPTPENTESPYATPAPTNTPTASAQPVTKYDFKFQQYDGKGDGWSVPLSEAAAEPETKAFATTWKGRKYLVAVQSYFSDTTKPDSIEKGSKSNVALIDVIDPETGKIVKSFTQESPQNVSPLVVPASTTNGIITMKSVLDAVGSAVITYELLDPTSGTAVDKYEVRKPRTDVIGSAGGKLITSSYDQLTVTSIPGADGIKTYATYNNMVIGNKIDSTGHVGKTTVILDGTTGKQIAAFDCANLGDTNSHYTVNSSDFSLNSSPDGRYITIKNMIAIDTKDGKGFCGIETPAQKQVKIDTVDNDGNVYGSADKGYFKVGIADGKVTAEDSKNPSTYHPTFISPDGWGVFPIQGSGEKVYAIPLKK